MTANKKIGILYGKERSFPMAFIEAVNRKNVNGITAEPVRIDKVVQAEDTGYAVIVDRISQDVPFYRAYLKNAAISGAAVINNPFWWSADEKFFNNCLAEKIGVPVPKTVILPSRELPPDTSDQSFTNLAFPLDWESIFHYVGFPAYMKPFAGGGWKNVYKLHNAEEFYQRHGETGQLVMMLQEEIVFTEYYRCYCIGGKYVRVMPYEPRNPHHLRYSAGFSPTPERLQQMVDIRLQGGPGPTGRGFGREPGELAMDLRQASETRDAVSPALPAALAVTNRRLGAVIDHDAQRGKTRSEGFECVHMARKNQRIECEVVRNQRFSGGCKFGVGDPVVVGDILQHRPDALEFRIACEFGNQGGRVF